MKIPHLKLNSAMGSAVCSALLLLAAPVTRASSLQVLSGHIPPGVANLTSIGRLEATNRLRLDIELPLRNEAQLDTLLQQLYDSNSPNYHQYLKPEEFAERFGPTVADYAAISRFASANGLSIAETHPNRTLLEVEGAVPDIEKAFHVHLLKYNHPTQHRVFYAPDAEPSVDLGVTLLHVGGLDDYVKPVSMHVRNPLPKDKTKSKDGKTVAYGGGGPGGTYIGGDFRAAYAPGVSLNGAGQKVALFELDGYFSSDILDYEAQANEPNVLLTNVLLGGFPGNPQSVDGDGEVSLDIEMVLSMAPGLDEILVYEGYTPDGVLNRIATDDLANQISSSWGWGVPEPDTFDDGVFKQFQVQGQTYCNASGDFGTTLSNNIIFPADDPYIMEVGGTTLTTPGVLGSWVSDVVWSWFTAGTGTSASTGGFSSTYPIPTWQQGVSMATNGGSTTFRNFPDVAMTADNIWVVYDQGQGGSFGGTSCAAPLWAAFTAMINQQGHAYGYKPVGFMCPAIYNLCEGPRYDTIMHDVVVGNNTNYSYPNQFFARTGYDLCDGWGTPTGPNFINALVPPLDAPVLQVVTNTISGGNGNGLIDFDECNDLTFTITNIGLAGATGVQGYLYSTTLGAIVAQSTVQFPNLAPGQGASSTGFFTLSTESSFVCGTPVDLVLVLKYDQGSVTNDIELPSGIIGPPLIFSNTTPYVVPEASQIGVSSPIIVAGVQSAAKISVAVYATTEFDEGLGLSLVSPNGTTILLTRYGDGGLGANYGSGCSTNEQTIFDDGAATPISDGTAPFVNTYQPAEPLSTFLPLNGTNLNGVWQLTATELFNNVPATLDCWSLIIEPYDCTDGGGQCPGAELSIGMTVSPNPALVNSNVVYNITVSNAGPSSANSVVVSQTLPPGFSFVTTSNYPVPPVPPGANLQLSLGSLPVYGTALVSVITIPSLPGFATSVATVGSTQINPNPINTTASASTLVTLPSADLGVTMSASPPAILQNQPETFVIVVTNNGPFAANGVTLTNELPSNANFVSSTVSQGSVVLPGVQFDLGTLAPGSNAVVTVTVKPTGAGNVTDVAQVGLGPFETDPNSLNNTASFTVTVGPSADLGVSASVIPPTVVSGADYTYVATVANNGPSAATTVTFNQTIPGGTGLNASTFVSSSAPGVNVANGNITWNVGNLPVGATASITNVLKAPAIPTGGKPIGLSSTFSVFGQPGDPITNNNVVTVINLVEVPTITVVPVSAILVSQGGTFTNGAINPNETVGIQLFLQNTGNLATTNLVGTLQSSGGVSLPSGSQTYGALMPGASPVGGYYTFLATGTNGGTVVTTLTLQDGSANLGAVSYVFYLPQVQTFWNTNPIYIPATNFVPEPDSGPAFPYPSTLQVSNLTGFVSKVNVTVSNLNHTYPHDIGLLLVGPAANSVLMDAAANYATEPASNVDLVFDSTASLMLPNEGNLTSGAFQPANYNLSDVFTNATTPGGANALNPPYGTNLAGFNGMAPNGVWALYAHDNVKGDAGIISNGWAVTITTVVPVNPTNSLSASIVASTNQTVQGDFITYFMSVTNQGAVASDAYLTNVLPSGLTFVSATGNYTQNGATNIFDIGTLAPGAGVTITNLDIAVASGSQTNTIVAGLPVSTFTIGANSASATVNITVPVADLAAGISVNNNPAVMGQSITYTLSLTNLGPSNSIATSGSFPLAGLSVSNVTTTQGTYTIANGALQCSFLGTIPVGNVAVVTVTATPANTGTLTNVWTVSNPSDTNSAATTLTVNAPTPIIAPLSATLLTQTGNGAVNTSGPMTVAFTLVNHGFASTSNLMATLLADNNILPMTSTPVDYGAIPPGGTATGQFTFTVTGSTAIAVLALTDGTNQLPSVSFTPFQTPTTTTFANSGSITINQVGPATPYQSEIIVSGLTNSQGSNLLVSKVTVTLNGFAHTFPHDVNALLQSPSGQELIFMGHAGGAYSVSGLNFTFDDAATQSLPTNQLASGTFLPTDYAPVDVFPDLPPASAVTSLAIFNGANPNGEWSLFIYDDTPGNGGVVAGGWGLDLTAVSPINPAAVLAVGAVSSPNPAFGGNYLSYLITVTNLGPETAPDVVLTDVLPASVIFSDASASQGTASNNGNTVTCSLGAMTANAVATVTIRVIAGAAGTIVDTATASATNTTDLYQPASTATNSVTVINPNIQLQGANSASGLQLTVLGQPSQTYVIQSSLNLLNWTPVFTNTTPLNSASFVYAPAQTNSLIFYRVLHTPQ